MNRPEPASFEDACGTEALQLEAPLTEPEIIPSLFLDGVGLEVSGSIVKLTGWAHVGGHDVGPERRVVARLAISNSEARRLQAALRTALARGGH
jgi:hypothetical protein